MVFADLSLRELIEAQLPLWLQAWLPVAGVVLFGAVVGWVAGHVLRRTARPDVKWLASLVGVLGGGAVTALFPPQSVLFGAYCVGLAGGFFTHAGVGPRPAAR